MLSRWISAITALALLLGTLSLGGAPALVGLCSFVVLVATIEYAFLFERISLWSGIFVFFNMLVYATQVLQPELISSVLMISFVSIASAGLCLYQKSEPRDILAKIQWPLVGLLYTAVLPALAVHLLYELGWPILLFLLVTVFFGDIFAFFFGLYMGEKKLFPLISPKKTIAGSLGGLLGSIICGGAFLYQFSSLRSWGLIFFVCLMIGGFAQLGDFFESLLKRIAGKKDSGQLMPGHGGMLDRLDGVYFGSAVLFFFCQFFDFASYF
jgi:phosphatidate cytidylyltransferase